MRVLLLLLVATLAGCLDETTVPPLVPDDPVPEPRPVSSYGGNGTPSIEAAEASAQYFSTGMNGPEPNMGITSSGAIFISAYSTILRSLDDGETWTAVHTHDPLTNNDPMMWVDPWTDCIYNVPMFPILLGAAIYSSCDDGDTWSPIFSQNVGHGVYDHQKLASALPGPDAAPVVGVAHPTALIICYNALVATQCAMSYDGGLTWPIDQPIWSSTLGEGPACAGQQSHPTGAPDGTIVVAKAWGCAEPFVIVSTDSGVNWEIRGGPTGVGANTLDPEIAFTDDGTMYMLYQSRAAESRAHLARSTDMGYTWDGPWDVTPPGMNSTIFAALAAGTSGRVAMSFHATNYTGYPSSVDNEALWHTYTVISENADQENPTFVSYRVQPENDPVQVGSICKGNNGCHDGNRNLLDFIDGAISPNGTFFTVVADGCVNTCADGSEQHWLNSRARVAAVARLDGWSLFADE